MKTRRWSFAAAWTACLWAGGALAQPSEPSAPDGPVEASPQVPDAGTAAPPPDVPTHEAAPAPDETKAPGEAPEESPEEAPITALPKLLERAEAPFPEAALTAGIERASVVLDIDIDTEGQVEGVTVIQKADPPGYGFDEAAVDAVYRFRFSPAMAGQTPVPVRVTYRYDFLMEAPAPKAESGHSDGQQDRAPAPAPVVNFDGTLRVRGTREPVAGTAITVFQGPPTAPSLAFEATTDAAGHYQFYDLPPGTWNVLIEAEGFFPVRTTEDVKAGERLEATYYIERGAYSPFDVLVEATRPRKEVNRMSLQTAELERIPGTAGDVLNVVQNLPGVARPPQPGLIIVRGAAPEDTKTVVDGMQIPLIYHFFGLRSVIPTPMLNGIDFYPGNFAPEFGRATGGIIDVRLKDLQPKRFSGNIDVSLLDTSLYVEVPLGDKGVIAVAGRRSYLDFLINAAASQADGLNVVAAPRYYDAQLLAAYRPAPGHHIRAFGLLSDDRLKILFENPGDASVELEGGQFTSSTTFYRGILEYDYTPSEQLAHSLRVSAGTDIGQTRIAQFNLDYNQDTLQVRDSLSVGLSAALRLKLGVDYLLEHSDFDAYLPAPPREGSGEPETDGPPDFGDPLRMVIDGLLTHSLGAFTHLELTLFERLLLIPGVRYDYFTRTESHRGSPRITARAKLNDQWTVKGGAGLFYQEPTIDETNGSFGNPDLDPEGAVHYSAGVEYQPLDYLTVDVTGFYKTLFDVVMPNDGVVERGGETVPLNLENTGEGRAYGLEVLARHNLSNHFTGWISYTLMRSERREAPEEATRLFDYDQTHILTVLGTYELPRNWEVGFRFRLVSGLPATPVTGSVYDADRDAYAPVLGATNTDRVPPFHQLDIRVDKHWIFDTWRLSAYLDVQNIYNRQNPNTASYNFDYSRRGYSQGLPILPILGLRAEY